MKRMMAVLAAAFALAGCREEKAEAAAPDTRPRVKVCALSEGVPFEDAVTVQGSVRTKFVAAVASRLPGTVDEVLADEGDAVKAGQPLFQVDRVNLENQVAIARDDQAVAAAARAEALAAQAEAEAAQAKAVTDEARFGKLYTESRSVTKDAWEKAQLQLRSSDAALARAKAAVATADAKILQAATALRIAEKNLADSRGLAPFDGVITQKLRDRGDYVGAGTALFTLDDPRVREACFLLNADRYAAVKVGETEVETSFGQRLPITYKAPTVNAVSRTFEVRAVLKPDAAIAPGMLCDARIIFSSRKGAALPAGAVGFRGGKHVAFVVSPEGTVTAVDVRKGATAEGLVEVLNPEALKGAKVVSEGMLLLNPGDAVKAVE